MDISFNEASLHENFSQNKEKSTARMEFDKFVALVQLLKKRDLMDTLFLPPNISECALVNGYTVHDWLNEHEPTVPQTHRQFFRSCLGRASYIKKDDIEGEFHIQYGDNSIGCLGGAFALEYMEQPWIISVLTHSLWKSSVVSGVHSCLNEDAELCESICELNNISDESKVDGLETELRTAMFENIFSGQDFWEQKEKLFPNLVFCDSVKQQVYEDAEKCHIVKVMKRLQKMQAYFSQKHNRYVPAELGMEARTESETVKANPVLRKYRLFEMPSGEKEYFFDHIGFVGKYTGGRIYFLPDVQHERCYIGYIGRHLPTGKF